MQALWHSYTGELFAVDQLGISLVSCVYRAGSGPERIQATLRIGRGTFSSGRPV